MSNVYHNSTATIVFSLCILTTNCLDDSKSTAFVMSLTTVVGSSGSGKTTFLNEVHKSHKCIYIRQYHNIRPYITVAKIPDFDPTRLPYWKIYVDEEKAETIKVGGTMAGEAIAGLSGGQRKLLLFELICQRVISRHDLLIVLDEPFAGVTDDFIPFIAERLTEMRQQHNVLLVTNDHVEALTKMSDNIIRVSAIDRKHVQINERPKVEREKAILALSVGQNYVYDSSASDLKFFGEVEVFNNPALFGIACYTIFLLTLLVVAFWNSERSSAALVLVGADMIAYYCVSPYVMSLTDWRNAMREESEALIHSSKAMNKALKTCLALSLIVIVSILEFLFVNAIIDGLEDIKFWVAMLFDTGSMSFPLLALGIYTDLSSQAVHMLGTIPFMFMIFFSTTFSPGSGVPGIKGLRYLFPRFYFWCMVPSVQDSMDGCPPENLNTLCLVLSGLIGIFLFTVYQAAMTMRKKRAHSKIVVKRRSMQMLDPEYQALQAEMYRNSQTMDFNSNTGHDDYEAVTEHYNAKYESDDYEEDFDQPDIYKKGSTHSRSLERRRSNESENSRNSSIGSDYNLRRGEQPINVQHRTNNFSRSNERRRSNESCRSEKSIPSADHSDPRKCDQSVNSPRQFNEHSKNNWQKSCNSYRSEPQVGSPRYSDNRSSRGEPERDHSGHSRSHSKNNDRSRSNDSCRSEPVKSNERGRSYESFGKTPCGYVSDQTESRRGRSEHSQKISPSIGNVRGRSIDPRGREPQPKSSDFGRNKDGQQMKSWQNSNNFPTKNERSRSNDSIRSEQSMSHFASKNPSKYTSSHSKSHERSRSVDSRRSEPPAMRASFQSTNTERITNYSNYHSKTNERGQYSDSRGGERQMRSSDYSHEGSRNVEPGRSNERSNNDKSMYNERGSHNRVVRIDDSSKGIQQDNRSGLYRKEKNDAVPLRRTNSESAMNIAKHKNYGMGQPNVREERMNSPRNSFTEKNKRSSDKYSNDWTHSNDSPSQSANRSVRDERMYRSKNSYSRANEVDEEPTIGSDDSSNRRDRPVNGNEHDQKWYTTRYDLEDQNDAADFSGRKKQSSSNSYKMNDSDDYYRNEEPMRYSNKNSRPTDVDFGTSSDQQYRNSYDRSNQGARPWDEV